MVYKPPHSLSFIPFNRTRMEELKIQKRPENNHNNNNKIVYAIQKLNWIYSKRKRKWRKMTKEKKTCKHWLSHFRTKIIADTVGRTWADAAIRTPYMIPTHEPYRLDCLTFMRLNRGERDRRTLHDRDKWMDFVGNMAAIKKLHLLTNTWTMFMLWWASTPVVVSLSR